LSDGDLLDEIHPAVDHHFRAANAAQLRRYWAPYDFDDLNTGAIQWQVPLGEVSALAAAEHATATPEK
jgi:hypothetical protein